MELDDISDQAAARHSYHMASYLFGKSGLPDEVEEQVMRDTAYYPTLHRSGTEGSMRKLHWVQDRRLDKYLVIMVALASTITLGLKCYTLLTPDWIHSTAVSHVTIGIGLLNNCSLATCKPTTLSDAPYFFCSNILVMMSLLLLVLTIVSSFTTLLINNTVCHKLELKNSSYWKFGDCFFYHLINLTLSCVALILQAVLYMYIQAEDGPTPLHPLHLQQSNDYNTTKHTLLAHNLTNNFTSKYSAREGTLT